MKKWVKILGVLFCLIVLVGCSKVPAGHVGIKVYLLGTSKGVDSEELGVGRYWIGINEELYLFPTFQQNYVWTKDPAEGSPDDESLTFQTSEGLSVNADVGISYHIKPEKVSTVFQKYRRGVEEITDTFLRNMVRDSLVTEGSVKPIESVYGSGKNDLMEAVQDRVRKQVEPLGIVVERIYWIGNIRVPDSTTKAINKKIEATQQAVQRENEVKEAEARAKKKVAEARGKAESILAIATAQAKANEKIASSITPTLIRWEYVKKWNGAVSRVNGSGNSFLLFDMKDEVNRVNKTDVVKTSPSNN